MNHPPVPSAEQLTAFAQRVRTAESGDAPGSDDDLASYGSRNDYGYLGAYQFGMARLTDLGLAERIPGTDPRDYSNHCFRWREGWSEERFLADVATQDRLFQQHVRGLIRWIFRSGFDSNVGKRLSEIWQTSFVQDRDVLVTLSGMVAVCHLLGPGGLKALLIDRRNDADAYGTHAVDYLKELGGCF